MHGTNLALAALVVAASLTIGWKAFLMVHLPICLLAGSAGVWLFYVQHQFEDTYWRDRPEWSFHLAALHGSSWYDLPRFLHWWSGNIGFHHIHHLSSHIPNYRLRECLRDFPALEEAPRLTLWSSLRCARLKLWDEERRRQLLPLESFRERRRSNPGPRSIACSAGRRIPGSIPRAHLPESRRHFSCPTTFSSSSRRSIS